MTEASLTIRELEVKDIDAFASYWLNADKGQLAALRQALDIVRHTIKLHFILYHDNY